MPFSSSILTETELKKWEEDVEKMRNLPMYTLSDYPHTAGNMSVRLTKEDDKVAYIYEKGVLKQFFVADVWLWSDWYDQEDQDLIHFLDFNFDGYKDIYIGRGESRTHNSVLLYNPSTDRYDLMEIDHHMQDPIISPKEKAIYTGGSESACEFSYRKSVWKGHYLKDIEVMFYINNLSDYNETLNNRETVYTLLDANDNIILKTNELKELPPNWQKVMQ